METIKKESRLQALVISTGVIALLGLIFWLAGGVNRNSPVFAPSHGIIVGGEGSVTVKPDIARINLGVETEALTAGEAQKRNAELMTKVVNKLKTLGLMEKDIQTTGFKLYPVRQYFKEINREKITGYRVVNQVTVTVRDLAKLGEVIDSSIKAGANNIDNVFFSVESVKKWQEKAIAEAIKNARSKAEGIAKASGVKIRKVISIIESNVDLRPFVMNEFQKRTLAADAVTPIEMGSVKVNANVQMNFSI